jgi:hypothetical protein
MKKEKKFILSVTNYTTQQFGEAFEKCIKLKPNNESVSWEDNISAKTERLKETKAL